MAIRLLPPGLVTLVVGATYLVVDAGPGRVGGAGGAAAVATVVASALALPTYGWGRRIAERLDGGRGADYRLLAQLAALPPPPTRGVTDLETIVTAVGRGLGAGVCTLTLRRPGLRDRVQTWTRPGADVTETRLEVPLRYGGEVVGTLAVDRVTVAGTQAERRKLLDVVADSLGVVLQATRSRTELERQLRAALAHAAEIATARRRGVAEADSERRRIERDLHDGAQHHLVTLSLSLGLVEHEVGTGRLDEARVGLARLAAQTDAVEELLSRTTRGMTSQALTDDGLVAALRAEFAQDDPPVDLQACAVGELPPEVAAAVYFCVLEAVNNARKHAPGAAVRVRLAVERDRLSFAVQDDGPGWYPEAAATSPGRGLRNVSSRMAAVGGEVTVRSAPGHGTTMEGVVPLPEPAPAPAAVGVPARPELLDQVRAVLRSARETYHGTPYADRLHAFARFLEEPLRIAVIGSVGAPAAELAAALAAVPWPGVRFLAVEGPEAPGRTPEAAADAYVVVADGARPRDGDCFSGLRGRVRPTHAVGVLVGDGPAPELHRLCQAVAGVRPGVATGHRPGEGVDLAAVRHLVGSRLVARAGALKARTVLSALETLVGGASSGVDVRPLLYRLEEIRSGAHELAELDLLDAMCAGDLAVTDAQRRSAQRLLGADGVHDWARLGCAPGAGPAELVRAAQEQMAEWQRTAAHPASSATTRHVAGCLVRTCERLLSSVTRAG
ncbi:sensor histidine kinase [Geodermatophilus sabuli]|uniref:sensor histidine kinase n=1 Tax=Geodermatophilus sabuli TaxID=1564158 RepID=UPI000C7B4C70|nr:GAF domain-containing sensor histidine kinase [Geodermatophilus sabuli]MBB3086215.1 signal transduction histidine kinase [Geodermatophilus sabuli]